MRAKNFRFNGDWGELSLAAKVGICACSAVAGVTVGFIISSGNSPFRQPDPDEAVFWIHRLEHGVLEQRRTACSILGAWEPKDQKTIEALVRTARCAEDTSLRELAVIGLRNEQAVRPVLLEIVSKDPDPSVQQAACLAVSGCIMEHRRPSEEIR